MATFCHSGDLGDIIYSLPIVRDLGGGIYYLRDWPEITKPMTPARFEALKALMLAQPYIKAVEWYKGQKVQYDFCLFRQHYHASQTLTEAQRRHVCHRKEIDTKSKWLVAPNPIKGDRAIIARSARYHNPAWDVIWPKILQEYKDPIFIGLPQEHQAFCAKFGQVEYRPTPTMLDVANLIAGSPIFIGNQSSPNAVCEGLKHRSILETHKQARDCIFPRENARHIFELSQWSERQKEGSLMLLLQCHPDNMFMARDLVQLICEIELYPRSDIEFALGYRRDTNPYTVAEILKIARTKFNVVHSIKGTRRDTGWPNGCNALWQESVDNVWILKKQGKTNVDGILTFEPDCLPLRSDWQNVLKREWQIAREEGYKCLGHFHGHNQTEPITHVNGNAIFTADIANTDKWIGDSEPRTGWDVYAGQRLLKISKNSDFIYQEYRMMEIDRAKIESIRKNGQIPALFHGVKSKDGIKIIRQMFREGVLTTRHAQEAQETVGSPA